MEQNCICVAHKTTWLLLSFGLQTNIERGLLIWKHHFYLPFFKPLSLIKDWKNHTFCTGMRILSPFPHNFTSSPYILLQSRLRACHWTTDWLALCLQHTSFETVWPRGKQSRHPKLFSQYREKSHSKGNRKLCWQNENRKRLQMWGLWNQRCFINDVA